METPWFLVVATCLLAANPSIGGEALAAPQTDAGNRPIPQIWFNMGAISTPVGHHSWDLLYYQPAGPRAWGRGGRAGAPPPPPARARPLPPAAGPLPPAAGPLPPAAGE